MSAVSSCFVASGFPSQSGARVGFRTNCPRDAPAGGNRDCSACRPRLLLCDEPTTALDVTIQDQVLALLRELQLEQGFAVLYVSHDLAVVSTVCDSLAVMYGGRIVETGSIPQAFRRPKHPYTAGLLDAIPDFDHVGVLSAIPGRTAQPDLATLGCRFQPRCRYAQQDCVSGEFPLIPVREGGSTACIHSEVVQTSWVS